MTSHSVSMSEVSMLSLERILLKNGVLKDSDLARAESAIKNYGGQLEDVLLGQGACSEEDILAANAELFGVKTYQEWLAENSLQPISEVTNAYDLGKKWWQEQQAFPLVEIDDVIWIATTDVKDNFVQKVLARKTSKTVESVMVVVMSFDSYSACLKRLTSICRWRLMPNRFVIWRPARRSFIL